jgi:cellulose biosynthesis protein BcsQ
MTNEGRNGHVITFYSYKGGTGRTMALANTAWILAASGKKVLAVDWDLEAPGLDSFFRPFLDSRKLDHCTGVIDMITEYSDMFSRRRWTRAEIDELIPQYASVARHTVELDWAHFPPGGSLTFVPTGHIDQRYSSALGSIKWDEFYEQRNGGQFFEAMREDMRHEYDYILIDSRTGLSDSSSVCTTDLPDTLVVCFTLSSQGIDGASRIANWILDRKRPRPSRILPVPMRIDEGELKKAEAGRELARRKFARILDNLDTPDPGEYWGSIQFPYKPFYAYEEILATFGDAPGVSGSLLAACERLTDVITKGEVTAMPRMDEALRKRASEGYTRHPAAASGLHLAHAREDRNWAEWMQEVFQNSGYQVTRSEIGADWAESLEEDRLIDGAHRVVAILSRSFRRSARAAAFWQRIVTRSQLSGTIRPLAVRVGDVQLDHVFSGVGEGTSKLVDLVGLSSTAAAQTLLRGVDADRRALPTETTAMTARFPASQPQIWNVPTRNRTFTGRIEELDRLREQLQGGQHTVLVPAALHGLGGVGKTQLAKEYAHRYRSNYDLIWWISADQPEMVADSLAELAREIEGRAGIAGASGGGLPGGAGTSVSSMTAFAANAAVEALRQDRPTARWLLIFDNAREPADVRGYMPNVGPGPDQGQSPGPDHRPGQEHRPGQDHRIGQDHRQGPGPGQGHIIITSRNHAWGDYAQLVQVNVFDRKESTDHLRGRVPQLTLEQADRVAERLGDLPLAIEQAAAYMDTTHIPVEEYLQLLEGQLGTAIDLGSTGDNSDSVKATWQVSIDSLRASTPAAARLLEICAHFGPEPIARALLQTDTLRRHLEQLDPRIIDPSSFSTVFEEIGKLSLARIDTGDGSVQMHRLVQGVVRDSLDEKQREQTRHLVHQLLVNARERIEGEVDEDGNRFRMEQIWPHLIPSQADCCMEKNVRQLMLDRVRYLWRSGDHAAAQSLAEDLNIRWTESADGSGPDWVTLRLRTELSNALRMQGRYQESLRLDQDTLRRQSEMIGQSHVHTLMTAGNLGSGLRALGRFGEALELDERTYATMRNTLGQFSSRTLLMAGNLAVDHRLAGNYFQALEIDTSTAQGWSRKLGPDHRETLRSQGLLARDTRDLGNLLDALDRLRTLKERADALLGEQDVDALALTRSLAVSMRTVGQFEEAAQLSRSTYDTYRAQYGDNHPETRLCRLGYAADLWASGDAETALEHATVVHQEYLRDLGEEHPNTLGAADNVMVYLRGSGRNAARLQDALKLGLRTLPLLVRVLGEDHPFSLCSMANVAGVHGELGLHEEAENGGRRAAELLRARYGEKSLEALICTANLSVTLEDAGRPVEAQRLRIDLMQDLARALGNGHPEYLRIRSGSRVSRILELQQW